MKSFLRAVLLVVSALMCLSAPSDLRSEEQNTWKRVGYTPAFEVANESRSVRCTIEVLPFSNIFDEEEEFYARLTLTSVWLQNINHRDTEMTLTAVMDIRGVEHKVVDGADFLSASLSDASGEMLIAPIDMSTFFGRTNVNIGRTIINNCMSYILQGPATALPDVYMQIVRKTFKNREAAATE